MQIETGIIVLLLLIVAIQFYLLYQIQKKPNTVQLPALLRKESNALFSQLEAYLSLRDRLDLRAGLPYTRDWSASPDFLKMIVEHCLEAKPSVVLECSSGLTSLMLARCCQMNQQGRVYSLENGEQYALATREHIQRYQLEDYAEIRHAPLEKTAVNGVDYDWYAINAIPDEPIDMLVIDGPPGFIQKHSRYPAVPLLFEKLSANCVIFLDDAARDDEQEIIRLWQAAYPALQLTYIKTDRGCAVLKYLS
ncbi:class I SAM-dependent methyltransferase [Candidatus Venteria ishoeyi]|uniref:O-methyltransferase n=1 Tax=Candidatus Venteria ishoeyi TaxID=1899563 RepID=UPI0025A51136|nr:class I SAM-dependent methyltransferase [Candidatus Venteria ishoeyi]MDM8547528.1 class I SAM-dependent methyltransferase [Candidatus Venteria ishoeyi]